MDKSKNIVKNLMISAGITINGDNPWDINVSDDRFYKRVLRDGELGLGETYMDGWWDSPNMDQMIFKLFKSDIQNNVKENYSTLLWIFFSKYFNFQTKKRAKIVGKKHYDVGNKLYSLMLDNRMNYSCEYWDNTDDLEIVQEKKLEVIYKKLKLKKGMHVLDIGCGWGAFGKYAAENY